MIKAIAEFFRYLWCMIFHKWTRYDRLTYGLEPDDSETEHVCFCLTCGRDR